MVPLLARVDKQRDRLGKRLRQKIIMPRERERERKRVKVSLMPICMTSSVNGARFAKIFKAYRMT